MTQKPVCLCPVPDQLISYQPVVVRFFSGSFEEAAHSRLLNILNEIYMWHIGIPDRKAYLRLRQYICMSQ